jgi:hypothetical protein
MVEDEQFEGFLQRIDTKLREADKIIVADRLLENKEQCIQYLKQNNWT